MIPLLIAPFVEPEKLRSLAQNSSEHVALVRRHILENHGHTLTRTERTSLDAMRCSPEVELPVSLWARVWGREDLKKRIVHSRFLDVRTKSQLLLFLRGGGKTKFNNLYQWYIREIYHGRSIRRFRPKCYAVRNVICHLDDTKRDLEVDRFVFKRTAWGFNVYEGPRILAYGEDDEVFMIGNPMSDLLPLLVSDKFVFDTCLGVYNQLIDVQN